MSNKKSEKCHLHINLNYMINMLSIVKKKDLYFQDK